MDTSSISRIGQYRTSSLRRNTRDTSTLTELEPTMTAPGAMLLETIPSTWWRGSSFDGADEDVSWRGISYNCDRRFEYEPMQNQPADFVDSRHARGTLRRCAPWPGGARGASIQFHRPDQRQGL